MDDRKLRELQRVAGSVPWLKVTDRKDYRAKVFKSGNSMALRLPAELGLKPGVEMNLRVEDGEIISIEPVDRPKRKFNIDKVAGSATRLKPLPNEGRGFEEPPIAWPDPTQKPLP